MDDAVPFASHIWFQTLGVLLFARGMDFLSTWVATPDLRFEGNPIAKFMGWKWGTLFNLAICIGCAFWPLPALIISTCSVLVAARNFQQAWAMRPMGGENYCDWFVERLRRTGFKLFFVCLIAEVLLTALVGTAVICFTHNPSLQAIGTGIIGYASAVLIFTLLALWRMRRAWRKGF